MPSPQLCQGPVSGGPLLLLQAIGEALELLLPLTAAAGGGGGGDPLAANLAAAQNHLHAALMGEHVPWLVAGEVRGARACARCVAAARARPA